MTSGADTHTYRRANQSNFKKPGARGLRSHAPGLKVRDLLHMIYKIYDLNDHKLYTNELFVKASKLVEQARHQKAATMEQRTTTTVEVRMQRMTKDKEKSKRRSFKSTWWTIERKRKSLIEKATSKKYEVIVAGLQLRK